MQRTLVSPQRREGAKAVRSACESPQVPLWSGEDERSQSFWSAATCRRYGPGVGRKEATSRRTPYRTRHLSVFCAHPAGSLTPTSNSLCSAHLTAFAIRCHPKGRTRGLGTRLNAETKAAL